jgi:alkanesulfonate monooxygenase SsuD/methylene tetrahydromethanopterin reductase-like flavin-dependent oxidoreductase (luciferase family)
MSLRRFPLGVGRPTRRFPWSRADLVDISCAFPPVPETPEHIALAERLASAAPGSTTPRPLQLDVWMTLARAAERTRTIELGPGVLIPSLRTAGDRGRGGHAGRYGSRPRESGYRIRLHGRLAMGQRSNPWSFVAQYARQLRALLAGGRGGDRRCAHPHDPRAGAGSRASIRVPMIFGTRGPKGEAVARELGDGVFTVVPTAGLSLVVAPHLRHRARSRRALRFRRASSTPRERAPPSSSTAPTICRARRVPTRGSAGRRGVAGGHRSRAAPRAASAHPPRPSHVREPDRPSRDHGRGDPATPSRERRRRFACGSTSSRRGDDEIAFQPAAPTYRGS